MSPITPEELRNLLRYEDGRFFWLAPTRNKRAGAEAGGTRGDGRWRIRINYRMYYRSQLVWLWHHGTLPDRGVEIDHKSRDPSDDRIENLRLLDHSANSANRDVGTNNTSGITGVNFDKHASKWRARVRKDGELVNIGLFDTLEGAANARNQYLVQHDLDHCYPLAARPKYSWPLLRWRKNKTGRTAMVDCGMMPVEGRLRRVRFFYKTMEEAQTKAALMRVARQNEGDEAFALQARTRVDAQRALKLLEPHGLTLTQAAQFYVDNIDVIQNAKTYSETLAELLRAKEQDGKSERYLRDMRNRLEAAGEVFGDRLIHSVKTAELDDYLRSLKAGGVTRNNFRRLLSVLFGFAVKRRYALKNPVAQIDVVTVEQGKPPILSVRQAHALMVHLEPELVPSVALALFAGLRPESELFRLDWRHIDLEERSIDIDKSKNVGSHRYVTIQDNLLKWLKPHARKSGAICRVDYYGRLQRVRAKAVASLQRAREQAEMLEVWPGDVLRHSYASYHCAHFKDSRLTSQEMGHSGDLQIFNRHYRNRVKEMDARAFWEICPSNSVPASVAAASSSRH